MSQDLWTHLPSEIITNILSRLSVRSIAISKCVCQRWLDLLEADDFVNFHLTRSAPALAVLTDSNWCEVFELEDELDLDRGLDPLTKFDFPEEATIEGSANGLLFLHNDVQGHALFVCNPITRQICELPSPPRGVAYGFGASKIGGQHKVVCIDSKSHNSNSDCHVYTLGRGSWRRVESNPFEYVYGFPGAFVDGNLHWIVAQESMSSDKRYISCFDIEKECFSTFPYPPIENRSISLLLFTLRDCLCVCDESSANEIVIWLVKDYGVEKRWSKEYVLAQHPDHGVYSDCFEYLQPIKVFKNGDILMLWDEQYFYYYINKTKTHQDIGLFDAARDDDEPYDCCISLMLLTPSFLSLTSLGMENVISF